MTLNHPNSKTYTLDQLQKLLPDFIDDEYPKGESKDRGQATVAITLYTLWLRKRELEEETITPPKGTMNKKKIIDYTKSLHINEDVSDIRLSDDVRLSDINLKVKNKLSMCWRCWPFETECCPCHPENKRCKYCNRTQDIHCGHEYWCYGDYDSKKPTKFTS